MNFKTLIAAGVTLLFAGAVFMAGTTAVQAAEPPGGHLNIVEVELDFETSTMYIYGEDFDFGEPLMVTLGTIGPITDFCSADPQLITCIFLDEDGCRR